VKEERETGNRGEERKAPKRDMREKERPEREREIRKRETERGGEGGIRILFA